MPTSPIKEKLDLAVQLLHDESLPLQQRLTEAYLMNLIQIKAADLPKELAEAFRELMKPFAWQDQAKNGPEIRPLFNDSRPEQMVKLSQDILSFADRYNQLAGIN